MADVFISYARQDRVQAAMIGEFLTGHGFSVWWIKTLTPEPSSPGSSKRRSKRLPLSLCCDRGIRSSRSGCEMKPTRQTPS